MQELQAAKHWINQEGWDAAGEGRAVSPATGEEVYLRLDWADVKRKLTMGAGTMHWISSIPRSAVVVVVALASVL